MIAFLGVAAFGGFVWGIVALVKGKAGAIVGRKNAAKVAGACFLATVVLMAIDPSKSQPKPAAVPEKAASTKETISSPAVAPPKAEPTKAEPVKAEPPKEEKPPADLKEYLAWLVNKEAGATSNLDKKPARIRSIDIEPLADGTGQFAFIQVWSDDNLTNNMIRTGIQVDSTKIFKRLFTEREDAPGKVVLQWYFPGQDVKGNSVDLPLVTINMTKKNAATFNWQNFTYSNLAKAADSYGEHPALSK